MQVLLRGNYLPISDSKRRQTKWCLYFLGIWFIYALLTGGMVLVVRSSFKSESPDNILGRFKNSVSVQSTDIVFDAMPFVYGYYREGSPFLLKVRFEYHGETQGVVVLEHCIVEYADGSVQSFPQQKLLFTGMQNNVEQEEITYFLQKSLDFNINFSGTTEEGGHITHFDVTTHFDYKRSISVSTLYYFWAQI